MFVELNFKNKDEKNRNDFLIVKNKKKAPDFSGAF